MGGAIGNRLITGAAYGSTLLNGMAIGDKLIFDNPSAPENPTIVSVSAGTIMQNLTLQGGSWVGEVTVSSTVASLTIEFNKDVVLSWISESFIEEDGSSGGEHLILNIEDNFDDERYAILEIDTINNEFIELTITQSSS